MNSCCILLKCNAITFLDNNFTWFTCPDFDVFTKKLHVSKLISKLISKSY